MKTIKIELNPELFYETRKFIESIGYSMVSNDKTHKQYCLSTIIEMFPKDFAETTAGKVDLQLLKDLYYGKDISYIEIPLIEKRTISFKDEERGKVIQHTFDIQDEDFWEAFGDEKYAYDLHYCEDYNDICVYRVKEGETETQETLHKEKIN